MEFSFEVSVKLQFQITVSDINISWSFKSVAIFWNVILGCRLSLPKGNLLVTLTCWIEVIFCYWIEKSDTLQCSLFEWLHKWLVFLFWHPAIDQSFEEITVHSHFIGVGHESWFQFSGEPRVHAVFHFIAIKMCKGVEHKIVFKGSELWLLV